MVCSRSAAGASVASSTAFRAVATVSVAVTPARELVAWADSRWLQGETPNSDSVDPGAD